MDHINRLDKSCLWRIIVLLPETDRTEVVPKVCLRWKLLFSSPKLTTIHDLNNDCLIVLLGKLPLAHLVTKASLVSKKWHGLVEYVLRQRTELDVVWSDPSNKANQKMFFFSEFSFTYPVSKANFQLYHRALFGKSSGGQLQTIVDNSYHNFNQNRLVMSSNALNKPIFETISEHFLHSHLTHLSLKNCRVDAEVVGGLLVIYREKLVSLSLQPVTPRFDWTSLWPIIDSMSSLRSLSLNVPRGVIELPAVLPNLESFQLWDYSDLLYPILSQLNPTKLRRLTLHAYELEQLLIEKPTLATALTHLNIDEPSGIGGNLMIAISRNCSELSHLSIRTKSWVR